MVQGGGDRLGHRHLAWRWSPIGRAHWVIGAATQHPAAERGDLAARRLRVFGVADYCRPRETRCMVDYLGVELTQQVRPPVQDPTLGIAVARPAPEVAPARRLVTLGDSLTHGFQHFAMFNSAMSWPAVVAHELDGSFRFPVYAGPGGHPLNLEYLARQLHANPIESAVDVWTTMEEVEQYYEFGPGSAFPDPGGLVNDNLAVWGWDLRDTLERTADSERALIGPARHTFIPLVKDSGHRAAVSVLDTARKPSGKALTPLEAARQLGDEPGAIETLCVWLGANNVLGSVVRLRLVLSGPDFQDLTKKSGYTVWTVADFTAELASVVVEVRQINAQHVLWATVPHVTIAPITHGLGGPLAECGRYFNYYARPWQTEQTFHPDVDLHLTGKQAWAIDSIIDGYNRALEAAVTKARTDGLDWRIVDLCGVLDRLAYRRNVELGARPDWWTEYPLPPGYQGLDTQFFTTDDAGARRFGGLFGLDGVHPTTAGYGLIAHEFLTAMRDAGVVFPGGPGADVDYARALANDTLLSDPPPRIRDVLTLLRKVDHHVDLIQRLLPGRLPF